MSKLGRNILYLQKAENISTKHRGEVKPNLAELKKTDLHSRVF